VGVPRRSAPPLAARLVGVIELSAHLFPPRRPRRRWSSLQRGALEPVGWPCCSQGTQARGRSCSGLVSGEARASAKAKPGILGWGIKPVRGRRCHRYCLLHGDEHQGPGSGDVTRGLGLAARGPWRSGVTRTRPRVVFKPNSGPGKMGIHTNVSRWVRGRRGGCWW